MKYIGDSLLGVSFSVQTPKPLDNRTVVDSTEDLYKINKSIAYEGMTVANIEDGYIYMLIDKNKITSQDGWVASYKSLQLISCSEEEYKEWKSNTSDLGQPIDISLPYIHQDTYYYIYEDSIEDKDNYYVNQKQYLSLLDQVNKKASVSDLSNLSKKVNEDITNLANNYLTKDEIDKLYIPSSFLDPLETDSLASILKQYYTQEEADAKFLTATDFGGSSESDPKFSFVKTSDYLKDKEDYQDQLETKVTTGSEASLKSLVVGAIKNSTGESIEIKPTGLYFGSKKLAESEEIPQWICIPQDEYKKLEASGQLEEDKYYLTYGEGIDDSGYITQANLDYKFLSKEQTKIYVTEQIKKQLDELITIQDGVLVIK